MLSNAHTQHAQDVIIVGGGLIGCLTALRLRQQSLRVTVIERGVAGAEASSAAAGILAAQAESPVRSALFALAIESRERYATLCDELRDCVGLTVGYRRAGSLELAVSDQGLDALEQKFEWQRALGHPVERLTQRALREVEPNLSSDFAGAIRFANDALVDPKRLTHAVAIAAQHAGAVFKTGAQVQRVTQADGVVTGVQLSNDTLRAGQVIIAAGAWSNGIEGVGLEAETIVPARGQIVEMLTERAPIEHVIYGQGGYLLSREDGRVIAGSTLEFVGFDKRNTVAGVHKILTMALKLVPSLDGATMGQVWSNFRPYTSDGAPLIGETAVRGLTIASGHYRSGILLAPVTARYVVDKLCGSPSEPVVQWDPTRSSLQKHGTGV
jgi:glycine oxidase